MASFCVVLLPLDVLGEIWDLTESVSEGFLTYSYIYLFQTDLLHPNLMISAMTLI